MESAKQGQITGEMKAVAEAKKRTPEYIREGLAKGTIVIPYNRLHKSLKN